MDSWWGHIHNSEHVGFYTHCGTSVWVLRFWGLLFDFELFFKTEVVEDH